MDVSLQKSFSKLITGHLEMVAPTDADRRGRTYWFVLHGNDSLTGSICRCQRRVLRSIALLVRERIR